MTLKYSYLCTCKAVEMKDDIKVLLWRVFEIKMLLKITNSLIGIF